MKVLFMTNIPAPYRVDFFNELAKKCSLTVLFEKQKTSIRNDEWFKDNSFNFDYVMLPKKKRLKKLFEVLKPKYDVIVMGTYSTKVSAISRFYFKLKRKKYIISADGGFIDDSSFVNKMIKKYFMGSANYWLSSGNETSKYMIHYGAKKDKTYLYHFTSINEDYLIKDVIKDKKQYRKELNIPSDKRIFLTVDRLDYNKGYDIFLSALEKKNYDDCEFYIVGTGEKEQEFKQFIKDKKIKNVHFVGFKDKNETQLYYKAADVFFFNTRSDVWGLVINEAMATGLPIISTNKAIASLDLLDNNKLYNPDDVNAFSKLVDEYASKSNQELIKEGKENLNKIKKYTIEQMVEDHIECFEDIIVKKKRKK